MLRTRWISPRWRRPTSRRHDLFFPFSAASRGGGHGHARRRRGCAGAGRPGHAAAALRRDFIDVSCDEGWQRAADPTVVALAAALGTTRPVEGRLTGGFSYGEVRTPDRSLAPTDNLALVAAAGEIQKRADANPSAANLHAWGVAQLLIGRHDASVETLESVWTQQRHDPRVAADLGTARLARAGALDAPEDLPRALEAIEQALTLDPNLPEAWFTKAVVLERLQIRQQAREAWTRYLQLDPDSSWSAEARRRLAALDSSTVLRPWTEIDRALRDPAVDAAIIREAVARDPMEVRELVVCKRSRRSGRRRPATPPATLVFGQAQRIIEALRPSVFPPAY